MKLAKQANLSLSERSHYLAACAQTIRRILVDHARTKRREKRGGEDARKVPIDTPGLALPDRNEGTPPFDIIDIDDALAILGETNERAARVVELRFFGGLSHQEIADELGVSLRTVNNDWKFSKEWLRQHLGGRQ